MFLTRYLSPAIKQYYLLTQLDHLSSSYPASHNKVTLHHHMTRQCE